MSPDLANAFRTSTTMAGLPDLVGQELGRSHTLQIDQSRIDVFARATDDFQWIHVDPVRAADGPFGSTIAHGYLSLSLLAGLSTQVFDITDASAIVNYGLEKVRFPTPVPVGSEVSLRMQLDSVTEVAGGLQLQLVATIDLHGHTKPAVVAIQLLRVYF